MRRTKTLQVDQLFEETLEIMHSEEVVLNMWSRINGVMTNFQGFEAGVLNTSHVKHVIEFFNTEYMFNHNAFKNAKKGEQFVQLKKIQRLKKTGFPSPLIFMGDLCPIIHQGNG